MHFVTNDNHESIRLDKSNCFDYSTKTRSSNNRYRPIKQYATESISYGQQWPTVVHYGIQVPAATSTPTHTEVNTHSSQQEDSYQQIILGIPQGTLYPTLSSLSSEERTLPEETQTLHDKVSKGLEKYLQDAKQCQALEVNYFDDNATGQNEEPNLEDAEQTIQHSKESQILPMQTLIADTNVARNPPESLKSDTGHTSRQHLPMHTNADKSVNKLRHWKTLNEMQMPSIQQKTLLKRPPQLSQSDYIHCLLLPMKSPYQPKR